MSHVRHRRIPRSVTVVMVILTAVGVPACTSTPKPTPLDPTVCPRLPADAIRENVTNLGTAKKPSPGDVSTSGGEEGTLPPVKNDGITYRCSWPSSDSSTSIYAFNLGVVFIDAADYNTHHKGIFENRGSYLLQSTYQGQGAAYKEGSSVGASWLCAPRPGAKLTARLDLTLSQPKHPKDPKISAKRLAEAVIPLLGCPGSDGILNHALS